MRQLPELVGEAEVVADEHAHPEAFDVDGHQFGAGAHVLFLAGVRERVDLAVAVRHAVGTGEHERVRGSLVVVGRAVGDLGARPADPDAVLLGHLGEELRRRTALGLAEVGLAEPEPGRERLGQHDQPGPRSGGRGDLRRQPLEVGVAVVPDDVVLDRGNSQRAHGVTSESFDRRLTASSITSSRLQHANRTRCRPCSVRA